VRPLKAVLQLINSINLTEKRLNLRKKCDVTLELAD